MSYPRFRPVPVLSLIAGLLLPLAGPASATAVPFLESGTLPDLSDPANYTLSDDLLSAGEGLFYVHWLPANNPATPTTLQAIEFYGYTQYLAAFADGVQGFEIVAGTSPINILGIERTTVLPAVDPTPLGLAATDVQRIRIDIDPVTIAGGDQVLIRGVDDGFENFYMARSAVGLSGIQLNAYNDPTFTVIASTTLDDSFYFAFYDQPLLAVVGDFDSDGDVDVDDVDLLFANLGDPAFDLTNDGNADQADVDELIGTILGTFAGDANLDGEVGTGDLAILAGNFAQAVTSWGQGDFNGDGLVGTGDLAILAGGFGQGVGAGEGAAAVGSIPEPAVGVVGVAAGLLVGRRRGR
ncbi:MAG: hypothetical protein AAF078_05440 [Planctomycetota bacterium]